EMRCDRVRPFISAMIDGEEPPARAARHLQTCLSCQAFQTDLRQLRRSIRIETVGVVPDVASSVIARLPQRRARIWLAPAAGFLAGALVGALLAGGVSGPRPSLAAELPEAVVAVQSQVDEFSGSFSVTERIKPGETRIYQGNLSYRAPETVSLSITQVSGPPDWLENTTVLIVNATTAYASRPFPCPALDGCPGTAQRQVVTVGRDPFSAATVAPLDLVVPASVFRNAEEPVRLDDDEIAGHPVLGMEVSAAQARPLLDALFGSGNWREIHDTDTVALWLERDRYTPLAVAITAGDGTDRAMWAARRGYVDAVDAPYLELRYQQVEFDADADIGEEFPPGGEHIDASFRAGEIGPPPIDPAMPLVATGTIKGAVQTEVWAWSDGRAWVRLDRTRSWEGPGLFGNLGGIVRPVELSLGPVYVAGDGAAVHIHSASADLVLYGSVESARLLELAGEVDVAAEAVPSDWPEAEGAATNITGTLIPIGLEDFSDPIVRQSGNVVVIDLIGSGTRSARITQQTGSFLKPPFDPDARIVLVRGLEGRYSPQLGLLEWIEEGTVVGISAPTLSMEELVAIARVLERP
ncbi:MAG: hypothetical protein Q8Q52_05735, partial [Acidimicrobiia bacterium]|nr:hypothetical protein [Acidimicrobiia bacterium]